MVLQRRRGDDQILRPDRKAAKLPPYSLSKLPYTGQCPTNSVQQAPLIDHLTHAVALDEALRDAVATKSDIAEVKHAIQLAVREMTIRVGAIVVALLAALVTIEFLA
jgi:hypothetical protein